jgi:PAS domain S-box-containing protein
MTTTHQQTMQELAEHFRPILEESPDGVYLWLDETHKICNERLATMFGYTVAEWVQTAPFLDSFVAEEDRGLYSWHYHNRVGALAFPATFRFRGRRKDGSTFNGHAVAYHFVRQVGE